LVIQPRYARKPRTQLDRLQALGGARLALALLALFSRSSRRFSPTPRSAAMEKAQTGKFSGRLDTGLIATCTLLQNRQQVTMYILLHRPAAFGLSLHVTLLMRSLHAADVDPTPPPHAP
jgi:hypothetical protein